MTAGRTYQVAKSLAATPRNTGALAFFHANVSKNVPQHCRYAGRHKIWPLPPTKPKQSTPIGTHRWGRTVLGKFERETDANFPAFSTI